MNIKALAVIVGTLATLCSGTALVVTYVRFNQAHKAMTTTIGDLLSSQETEEVLPEQIEFDTDIPTEGDSK